MTKLRICKKCWRYTMKEKCPICGAKTETAHPPKYSPHDKYWIYRAKALGVEF